MKHSHHRRLLSIVLFPIFVILLLSTFIFLQILLIFTCVLTIVALPIMGVFYAVSLKKDNYIENITDDDHRT